MLEYLKDWRVWIFVAILIILVVWVWIGLERKDVGTKTHDYTLSSDTSLSTDTASDTVVHVDEQGIELALLPTRVEHIDIDDKTASDLDKIELNNKRRPGQSAGEHACLVAMQSIFGTNARVQVRDLSILRNPKTGKNLELDIYIPEYKIACEYHGKQHYDYVPIFHKNGIQDLEYQRWKDTFKMDQCDKAGIFLITVPYNVPIDKIEQFIRYYISRRNSTLLEIEY